MATPHRNEALARANAETAERLSASRSSIQQSDEHIGASRKAIARSLGTLANGFHKPGL